MAAIGELREVERREQFLADQHLGRVVGGLDDVVLAAAGHELREHLLVGGVGLVGYGDAGFALEAVDHFLRHVFGPGEKVEFSSRAGRGRYTERDSQEQGANEAHGKRRIRGCDEQGGGR